MDIDDYIAQLHDNRQHGNGVLIQWYRLALSAVAMHDNELALTLVISPDIGNRRTIRSDLPTFDHIVIEQLHDGLQIATVIEALRQRIRRRCQDKRHIIIIRENDVTYMAQLTRPVGVHTKWCPDRLGQGRTIVVDDHNGITEGFRRRPA